MQIRLLATAKKGISKRILLFEEMLFHTMSNIALGTLILQRLIIQ